jgi:hypothetical protein
MVSTSQVSIAYYYYLIPPLNPLDYFIDQEAERGDVTTLRPHNQ